MKKIECDKCGYNWETNSELIWVTCPSCRNKVQNKKIPQKKKDKTQDL